MTAGGTVPDALNARKLGYINNLKGAHGEYRAFTDLNTLYPNAIGLTLKVSNKPGPDFIFRITEVGSVKIVEVKAMKSLSMSDLENYS